MNLSPFVAGFGLSVAACVGPPLDPDGPRSWGVQSDHVADRIRYDLISATDVYELDAFGGGSPNQHDSSGCVSSFNHLFFRGRGDLDREPNSDVEVILPAHEPGASSLVPPIDQLISTSWSPPQWRLDDGTILGLFGGTVTLERYDPDAVVLVFEASELCTLALWGRLDQNQYRYYTDDGLATECVPTPEVRLEASAEPPGSFDRTDDPVTLAGGTHRASEWRTLDGQPLCY